MAGQIVLIEVHVEHAEYFTLLHTLLLVLLDEDCRRLINLVNGLIAAQL